MIKLLQRVISSRDRLLFRFSNIIQKELNSICPTQNDAIAYGYYFPVEWTAEMIMQRLDPSKKNILSVEVVHNKVGHPTGKILFKFKEPSIMKKYMDKYSEDYITTEHQAVRVVIKPFQLRTERRKKEHKQIEKKNCVKVKNLDFDITADELKRLADDYGVVTYIDVEKRQSGQNKGAAKIYFAKKKQAEEFLHFIQGLLYKERRFTAQIINPPKPKLQIKEVCLPEVVMKFNRQIKQRSNQAQIL